MTRRLAGIAPTIVVALGLAMLPAGCASAHPGQGMAAGSPGRVVVDTLDLRRKLDSLAGAHRGVVHSMTAYLLLDRIIIRRVWDKMESLGLKNTKVHSKTFLRNSSVAMDSSVKYGLGVTTPNEMATLFDLLARGRAVNAPADSAMLRVLEHNTDNEMLVRFGDGTRVAHKTGATDAVRTDCALFYLSSRVVACVLTKENVDRRWVIDTEPQLTIARMGEAIVKAWGPRPTARKTP